jgi:hypothetical protein
MSNNITITWPTNTTEIIDKIRGVIGRNIQIFVNVSGIPCPNPADSLDPVTGHSTNPFCPTCGGEYWINSVSGYTVSAHVVSRHLDTPVWTQGGLVMEGDARIHMKYTVTNAEAVDNAEYYIVDGRRHLAKDVSLRGVPALNRIVVVLEQIDKED